MDEATLALHPVLRKCWMKRGEQLRIPAAGQQQLHHWLAAYNYLTDQVIWIDSDTKNTAAFIRFLEHLMASIDPSIPVVIVLDNASYHWSKEAQAALAFFEDDGLLPFWLPPYCSDLNRIERFWRHLKDFACANKLFASLSELVSNATRCLHQQNDLLNQHRFLFSKT